MNNDIIINSKINKKIKLKLLKIKKFNIVESRYNKSSKIVKIKLLVLDSKIKDKNKIDLKLNLYIKKKYTKELKSNIPIIVYFANQNNKKSIRFN